MEVVDSLVTTSGLVAIASGRHCLGRRAFSPAIAHPIEGAKLDWFLRESERTLASKRPAAILRFQRGYHENNLSILRT